VPIKSISPTLDTLRIGTRSSDLAMRQTRYVIEALHRTHPDLKIEIVEIQTSGDWKPAQGEIRLSEAEGGKGQFAKEIEIALIHNKIDIGVHSAKDVPSFLPDMLGLDHVLPREDPHDAFLSVQYASIHDLPMGAIVGTASLRRQAFVKNLRPDLKIQTLRGNVPTRLEKLKRGDVDATFLAVAGLNRLGLQHHITEHLNADLFLPAAGQGVIAIETRLDDVGVRSVLQSIHCHKTGCILAAERAALQALDGTCHTPIGCHAVFEEGDTLFLRLCVADDQGNVLYRDHAKAIITDATQAAAFGYDLGSNLKSNTPIALFG
jgi:hydroxymethylbilane synthase